MRWKSAKYHPTESDCRYDTIFCVDEKGRCFIVEVEFTNFDSGRKMCFVGNFTWKAFVAEEKIVKWQLYRVVDAFISRKLKVNYTDFC